MTTPTIHPLSRGGTIPKMTSVTIGRALQPFPRSKRSMRLSPHCAFQVGPDTHEGVRGKSMLHSVKIYDKRAKPLLLGRERGAGRAGRCQRRA